MCCKCVQRARKHRLKKKVQKKGARKKIVNKFFDISIDILSDLNLGGGHEGSDKQQFEGLKKT
jgi:hypothetical protein